MSDTNRLSQTQMTRGLKFWIYVDDEQYYPRIENNEVGQLCSFIIGIKSDLIEQLKYQVKRLTSWQYVTDIMQT